MKKILLSSAIVLLTGFLAFAQSQGIQISPSYLSAALLQDSDTTVTTQIFNNTAEEISFSFPGFTDRGSGGPDAYGYTWNDSDEDSYFYTWTEISETGTEITTLSDDNRVGPFDMGFDFPYYGETQNQFWISSNGAILFNDMNLAFANTTIPTNTQDRTNFIAALWDDLTFSNDNSKAYYQLLPDRIIIQFENASQFGNTNFATFQVVLLANGSVILSYREFSETFNLLANTIGLQSPLADVGLMVSCNQAYLHDELSIFFNTSTEEADFITGIQPSSGTIPAFSNIEVVLNYSSAGFIPGRYNQTVTCTTSDPAFDTLNIYNLMIVSELPVFIGTVTDAANGNTLEGVSVTAGGFSTTTGASGNYELQVTPGSYALTFEKPGYDLIQTDVYAVTFDQVVNISRALVLSDEFIVGGTVFAGIYQLDMGYVNAFQTLEGQVVDIFADLIDTLGYYNFPELTIGSYLLKAEPSFGSVYEGDYLPTYYGDVVHWADAVTINLTQNIFNADINLVAASLNNSNGPGKISGYIYQAGETKSGNSAVPAADIPVFIKQGNDHAMATSNSDGYFEFDKLEYGTYTMFAELFGKDSEFRDITINQANEVSETNNLFIYAADILYGTGDNLPAGVKSVSLPYPNPSTSQASLVINLLQPKNLKLELFNATGQSVSISYSSLGTGVNEVIVPVTNLKNGIYWLQISDETGAGISRKLIRK